MKFIIPLTEKFMFSFDDGQMLEQQFSVIEELLDAHSVIFCTVLCFYPLEITFFFTTLYSDDFSWSRVPPLLHV